MANTILLKRSSTASSVPAAGSLQAGELAVNLADQKLYSKTAGGTVVQVGFGNLTSTMVTRSCWPIASLSQASSRTMVEMYLMTEP